MRFLEQESAQLKLNERNSLEKRFVPSWADRFFGFHRQISKSAKTVIFEKGFAYLRNVNFIPAECENDEHNSNIFIYDKELTLNGYKKPSDCFHPR